jgi:hypothetical protein
MAVIILIKAWSITAKSCEFAFREFFEKTAVKTSVLFKKHSVVYIAGVNPEQPQNVVVKTNLLETLGNTFG